MKIEYNNLYVHFVFTTYNRIPTIIEKSRSRIEKYITGLDPSLNPESLVTIIADSSQRFINENKLCAGLFQWQQSCSAFSVSKGDVDRVCKYIMNQKEHHKRIDYSQEHEVFLKFYQQTIEKKKEE